MKKNIDNRLLAMRVRLFLKRLFATLLGYNLGDKADEKKNKTRREIDN